MTQRRQCARVNRTGAPCGHAAAPGSSFCWWHYPRGYNWAPTIVGIIVGLACGAALNEYYARRSETASLRSAYVAQERRLPVVHKFPAPLIVGSNKLLIKSPGIRARIFSVSPYELEVAPNGTLLLHGDIRNARGAIVAALRDSHLLVSPGLNYDINSDESAVEVVDPHLHPILQVIKPPNREELHLFYVSYMAREDGPPVRVEVCDEERCTNAPIADAASRLETLKTMFQYPGYRYPGVRAR